MQTKLKVKDKNDLAIPADLSIPAFLRRVQTKKEAQDSKELRAHFSTSQSSTWSAPAAKPKDGLIGPTLDAIREADTIHAVSTAATQRGRPVPVRTIGTARDSDKTSNFIFVFIHQPQFFQCRNPPTVA